MRFFSGLSWLKWLKILALMVFVALSLLMLSGEYVYRVGGRLHCAPSPEGRGNTPHRFVYNAGKSEVERPVKEAFPYQRYWLKDAYEHVEIKSAAHVQLRGWWIPASPSAQSTKAVVIAPGLRDSKEEVSQLVLASMLHRSGYHVLLADYRNNGTSDCVTGVFNGGYWESDDLLAMVQWVHTVKKVPYTQMGVHGTSLGGLTTLLALAKGMPVAAVVVEGAPYDFRTLVREELGVKGYPQWLSHFMPLVVWLHTGVTLGSPLPAAGVQRAPALLVITSPDDKRVHPHHSAWIIDDALRYQRKITVWKTYGDHKMARFHQPGLYSQKVIGFFDQNMAMRTTANRGA